MSAEGLPSPDPPLVHRVESSRHNNSPKPAIASPTVPTRPLTTMLLNERATTSSTRDPMNYGRATQDEQHSQGWDDEAHWGGGGAVAPDPPVSQRASSPRSCLRTVSGRLHQWAVYPAPELLKPTSGHSASDEVRTHPRRHRPAVDRSDVTRCSPMSLRPAS